MERLGSNTMNVLIICFSQTGNTRLIAEQIQKGAITGNASCRFMNLKDVQVNDLADYQLVGIGAPVYYYKEPFNVSDFISTLPDLKGQHWFIFCTHGNVIGNFFPSLSEKLHQKNAAVIGYHNSYAGITVPYYPAFSYTSGHPDSLDLKMAEKFGLEIVQRSRDVRNEKKDLIPLPGPVSSEEWVEASELCTPDYLAHIMPKLKIDPEKCLQCGECQNNCPVNGIDIESDPPRLQTPCLYCWNCVMICPVQAIQADWDKFVELAPENYRRYKKALDLAAAKGEFRWLVDPDSVRPDDPSYKSLGKNKN